MTEQPIVINKELAKVIGLNEAIVLQQIEYWININEKAKKENNFKEGYYWTYNTIDQWQKEFPFWSYNTVKRTLAKLENKKVLITATLNNKGYDRTKWYRIDYSALDNLANNINSNSSKWANEETSHLQDEKSSKSLKTNNSSKWANAIAHFGLMQKPKMSSPIPEITTETSTEISTSSSSKASQGIFKTFKANICELRPTTFKKFIEVVEQYNLSFLEAIIEECTLTNVKSYKGFEVALNNYVNAKCTTPEEVHQYAKDYSDKKKKPTRSLTKASLDKTTSKNKKQLNFINFKGREYTEEDYRFLEVQSGQIDILSIDKNKLNIFKHNYDECMKNNNMQLEWEENNDNGVDYSQRVILPIQEEKTYTEENNEELDDVTRDLMQAMAK